MRVGESFFRFGHVKSTAESPTEDNRVEKNEPLKRKRSTKPNLAS